MKYKIVLLLNVYFSLYMLLSFSVLAQTTDNPPRKPDVNVEDGEEMTQSKIREIQKIQTSLGLGNDDSKSIYV